MSGVGVIRRLLELMSSARLKCRPAIAACVLFEAAGICLAILGPYVLKILVDGLSSGRIPTAGLVFYTAGFVIAWTATTVLGPVGNLFSSVINARLARELTAGTVAGHLSSGRWRQSDSGRVQGLLERLPYNLAIVIDGLIWRTAPLAVQLACSLFVIVHIMSWTYVVGFAALAVGFVCVSWYGISKQIVVARAYNETLAGSGELIGDILKNARRVVANGTIGYEISGVESDFADRERSEKEMNRALVGLSGLQWAVVAGALFLVMLVAGSDVLHGRITSGDFVLVQAYAIRLVIPLSTVAFVLSQSAGALAAVGDLIDMQGTPPPDAPEKPAARKAVSIRLENVTFSYGPDMGGVTNITVDFPALSFTAIVGANGSGKSTLAQLISGQLTPDNGSILIGGTAKSQAVVAKDISHDVLYVPQRTALFNRSLRANLLYPPCKHDEATAVAILSGWEFQDEARGIDLTLPSGEGGNALSGGQAQKLEAARIMGISKPCLVLDEPTSALDPKSEAQVICDLRTALGISTTLIFVTHRIAEAADQVLWLRNGLVAGVGDHRELLKNVEYKSLWG